MGDLRTIDNSTECLRIENLFSIRECSLQLPQVCAFIGPQASGKSLLIKLVYFFREYIDDFLIRVADDNFSLRSYKSAKIDEFQRMFRGVEEYAQEFSVSYQMGDIELEVSKGKRSALKISGDSNLSKIGKQLKSRVSAFKKGRAERDTAFFGGVYLLRREDPEVESLFLTSPSTLFVPASRSFYSTVSKQIFEFLSADDRIEPLMARFGGFFESRKERLLGRYVFPDEREVSRKDIVEKMVPVLRGKWRQKKGQDYIQMPWGDVPLDGSSSGQQEAFPLLVSILMYPSAGRSSDRLLVEEPEAHLYPEAQKYVLDLMMDCALENRCGLMFTTHSPYILACLNTFVAKSKQEPQALDVGAFSVADGGVASLIDEDGLIDLNEMDQVSSKIAEDFMKYL